MDDQIKHTEPKPRAVIPREPLVAQGNAPLAIVPTTFEQVWRLAQVAAAAGTVKTPEQGAMIIMHGLEIGMKPMMALERIAIINGRKCIWGDGVPALPIARGLVEDWHEEIVGTGDEMTAACSVKRKGMKSWVPRTFSVADAKQAGLWQSEAIVKRRGRDGGTYEAKNDSPWYRYPKRMLAMRARVAFRDAFPDVYSGLHIAEEMQDEPSMRDVTPREDFKKVENPLADLPEQAGPYDDQTLIGEGMQFTAEAAERRAESLNELNEARGEASEAVHQHEAASQEEVQGAASPPPTVADKQQPPEARTEPAGEPEPQEAVSEQAPAKTEPVDRVRTARTTDEAIEERVEEWRRERAEDTLRDLAAKANARAPETFPLEVVEPGPPKQVKTTELAPVVDGNGFLPEALAVIANAIDTGKLNRWWRESRKQRTEAGLTAAQLDQLTQNYHRKFIQLSEV
jgi:hypothetical protein